MFKLREKYATQVENYLWCGCGGVFFVVNAFGWWWDILGIPAGFLVSKLFGGASLLSLEMSSGIVSISACVSYAPWSSLVPDILAFISLGANGSGNESSSSLSLTSSDWGSSGTSGEACLSSGIPVFCPFLAHLAV